MFGDKRKRGLVYRDVSIKIPDRKKNEDPVTDNQIQYIKSLAPDFEFEEDLNNLGKWQASAIITQLKEKRDAKSGIAEQFEKLFWFILAVPFKLFLFILAIPFKLIWWIVRKFFWLIIIIIILYLIAKSKG